jgi:hypothetical protein
MACSLELLLRGLFGFATLETWFGCERYFPTASLLSFFCGGLCEPCMRVHAPFLQPSENTE